MAEVKWIKFIVGTFDGDSFKRIRRARIGGEKFRDKLTAVWFELLELAGKSNQNGMLIDADGIPYRGIEDIATMIDRETEEVELCMQFYIKEKMIEIIDDIYTLANWEKYQNVKGLEDIREANRIRNIAYRKRKKQLLLAENDKRDITQDITMTESLSRDIDKELDIDINNKEKDTTVVVSKKKDDNDFLELTSNSSFVRSKFEEFTEQFNIHVDSYDGGVMANVDFEALSNAYRESKNFLQNYDEQPICQFMSWICKNYKSIVMGKYRDRSVNKTAVSIGKSLYEKYKAEEEAEELNETDEK